MTEAAKPAFDDLMLAMDAVDTLRHEASLADAELGSDERRAALYVRLREYYQGQGIEVSDEVLEKAVADMDRNRFVHEPLAPGLARTMGLAWVRRGRYARRTAIVAVAAAVLGVVGSFAWNGLVVAPRERAAAALAAELEVSLPAKAREAHIRAVAAAEAYKDSNAKAVADNHLAAAADFIARKEAAAAKAEIGQLEVLATSIEAKIDIARLVEEAEAFKVQALAAPADAGARSALDRVLDRVTEAAVTGKRARFESAKFEALALRERIDTPLEVRIVDRTGVRSGVFRVNDATKAKVYYLVVEAVDPSGRPVNMDIRNFETGRTENVSHWGVRVPEPQYRKLEHDKMSDGVVDDREAGSKPAGSLDVTWTIPAQPAQMITRW